MDPHHSGGMGVTQPWPPPPPVPRRPRFSWTALIAAVLAAAALVVAIIALTQAHNTSNSTPTAPLSPSTTPSSSTNYAAANRALCSAIAPLMAESDRTGKAFTSLGPAGSPASAVGVPKFISDTKDWLGRIQPVVDSHPDADPIFRRSLQRFVDDQRFLALDLQAGPWAAYDQTIWNDALGAYNGPLSTCWGLGIKW